MKIAAILSFAQQTVKIEKKKKKIIVFLKFMEKEVKQVGSPQDLNWSPKNYLVPYL